MANPPPPTKIMVGINAMTPLTVLVELSRVKKFAGTMVLFWPFAWSLTMTARSTRLPLSDFVKLLAEGFAGASLLHRFASDVTSDSCFELTSKAGDASGTTFLIGSSIAKLAKRTKKRPVADGRISVLGAMIFLAAHLVLLIGMIWKGNPVVWQLGLVSIFPLPGIYPLMKRITYWPQAWLGLAMNVGVPMGSVVLTGEISSAAGVLSVGAWAWTLWYDTIYACQDKKDDVKAGVKSTALLFREYTKVILSIFGSILVVSLFACGIFNGNGLLYFIVTVAGGALALAHQLWELDIDVPQSCWTIFQRNGFTFGAAIWSGFLLDYLLAHWGVGVTGEKLQPVQRVY